jgi:hypothetical protein
MKKTGRTKHTSLNPTPSGHHEGGDRQQGSAYQILRAIDPMAIQRNAAVCAMLLAECCGCGLATAATAFAPGPRPAPLLAGAAERRGACGRRLLALGPTCSAGELRKALKKTTGALTVSLEFDRQESCDYTENDLIVLSMQLRKIKCASLWAAGLGDVKIIRCLPALSYRVPAAAKECAKSGTPTLTDTLMDIALRLAATSRNQPKATFRGPVQSSTIHPLARPTKDRSRQQLMQAQRRSCFALTYCRWQMQRRCSNWR